MKVVGLSGTIGSGKGEVKDMLIQKFNSKYVTLSDVIRGELERRKGLMDRITLQEMGNEMRKKYGPHILAFLAAEYLSRDKDLVIIDGIRNPAEGQYLKKKFGHDFIWICVDAPKEIRFQRSLERRQHDDPRTIEEFSAVDDRDLGLGEPEYGQHTKRCMDMCDYKVVNDGTVEQLKEKVMKIMEDFMVTAR